MSRKKKKKNATPEQKAKWAEKKRRKAERLKLFKSTHRANKGTSSDWSKKAGKIDDSRRRVRSVNVKRNDGSWDAVEEKRSMRVTAAVEKLMAQAESCHTPELSKMPYREFLVTRYWFTVSEMKHILGYSRCEKCNSKSNLQVHHLTYDHRGNEHKHLYSLMLACGPCHRDLHGL